MSWRFSLTEYQYRLINKNSSAFKRIVQFIPMNTDTREYSAKVLLYMDSIRQYIIIAASDKIAICKVHI